MRTYSVELDQNARLAAVIAKVPLDSAVVVDQFDVKVAELSCLGSLVSSALLNVRASIQVAL